MRRSSPPLRRPRPTTHTASPRLHSPHRLDVVGLAGEGLHQTSFRLLRLTTEGAPPWPLLRLTSERAASDRAVRRPPRLATTRATDIGERVAEEAAGRRPLDRVRAAAPRRLRHVPVRLTAERRPRDVASRLTAERLPRRLRCRRLTLTRQLRCARFLRRDLRLTGDAGGRRSLSVTQRRRRRPLVPRAVDGRRRVAVLLGDRRVEQRVERVALSEQALVRRARHLDRHGDVGRPVSAVPPAVPPTGQAQVGGELLGAGATEARQRRRDRLTRLGEVGARRGTAQLGDHLVTKARQLGLQLRHAETQRRDRLQETCGDVTRATR